MKSVALSVVVPVMNEQDSIIPLHERLTSVLKQVKLSYEIIFVNDGSTDRTEERVLGLKDKKIRLVSFTKNFEKAAALSAGFDVAKGELVLTMDGDLQDDPRDIPRFLEKMKEGYDLVVGWKYNRQDPWTKTVPSKIFNWLVRKLTHISIHDSDCNFRLIRKKVLDEITIYSGFYRYIPSLAANKGFKIGEVKVNHNKRKYGKSKYGMGRLFTGVMDLISIKFFLSYMNRPLHFFGAMGIFVFGLGVLGGLYLLWEKFMLGAAIGTRPLLLLSILLVILGVNFFSIGLVGEMITRYSQRFEKKYVVK